MRAPDPCSSWRVSATTTCSFLAAVSAAASLRRIVICLYFTDRGTASSINSGCSWRVRALAGSYVDGVRLEFGARQGLDLHGEVRAVPRLSFAALRLLFRLGVQVYFVLFFGFILYLLAYFCLLCEFIFFFFAYLLCWYVGGVLHTGELRSARGFREGPGLA